MKQLKRTGHLQIPFGTLELVLLTDGYFTLETLQPTLAPKNTVSTSRNGTAKAFTFNKDLPSTHHHHAD